jgi:hypothetical protein
MYQTLIQSCNFSFFLFRLGGFGLNVLLLFLCRNESKNVVVMYLNAHETFLARSFHYRR